MSKAADLFRLFRDVPRDRRIFLRREYDRLGGTLRLAARMHRRFLLTRTRIAAVVGSLGKTSTTRALRAALGCPDRRFSYSNYGACLAANLLRVRPSDRHAVLEVGIAGPRHMTGNARMIRPDLVVVTSIGSDHNRSFPTLLDTRAEKVKMIRALGPGGVAILNGDDPHVRWMAGETRARVIFFGLAPGNDVRGMNVCAGTDSTTFEAHLGGVAHKVRSRLVAGHMIYPLLAAIAAVDAERMDLNAALGRLAELTPMTSRMELCTLPDGIRILDDSAKGSVESMHAAFDVFGQMTAVRKIVVLGNVAEPPGKARDVYRDLGRRLARCADALVCVGGHNMRSLRAAAVECGMSRSAIRLGGSSVLDAGNIVRAMLRPGDLVLVKGAGTQRLRRIVLQLLGTTVTCGVKHCVVKASACDVCPLLKAPQSCFQNGFVARSVRL